MKPLKSDIRLKATAIMGLVIMAMIYGACKKQTPHPPPVTDPCDTMTVSYTHDIIAIISTYCSAPSLGNCHDGTTPNAPALGQYAVLKAEIDKGAFEDHLFVLKDMPKPSTNGPKQLAPNDELLLKCWLKEGAPDN